MGHRRLVSARAEAGNFLSTAAEWNQRRRILTRTRLSSKQPTTERRSINDQPMNSFVPQWMNHPGTSALATDPSINRRFRRRLRVRTLAKKDSSEGVCCDEGERISASLL
jgi:hypothetical protein